MAKAINIRLMPDTGHIIEDRDLTYHLRGWLKPLYNKNVNLTKCKAYIDIYRGTNLASNKFTKKNRIANVEVVAGEHDVSADAVNWTLKTIESTVAIDNRNTAVMHTLLDNCWEFIADESRDKVGDKYTVPMLALMASGMLSETYVSELKSAGGLRALYRATIGVTGVQYPPRQDMIDAIVKWGWQGLYNCGGENAHVGSLPVHDNFTVYLTVRAFGSVPEDRPTPKPAAKPAAKPEPKPEPKAAPSGDVDVNSLTFGELTALAGTASKLKDLNGDLIKQCEFQQTKLATMTKDLLAAQNQVESLKDAAVVSSPAVVSPDGAEVEVLGVKLPRWGCKDAPAIDDRYDLASWRAVMKVNDATFTANAAMVAKSIIDGDSVRLVGPPSVGKTSGIKQVAGHCGAKFFLVQCGEGATDLSLIGSQTVSEGEMKWQDGSITHAVRWAADNPDTLTLIVLDEVDHLQPEVQSLLHGVLEGGLLQYDGIKEMTVTPNVRFVATANTSGFGDITGRHSAAKISDTAFVSRWNVTYDVTYLPPKAEEKVLIRASSGAVTASMAKAAVETANATRAEAASVSTPIVLRQLLSWSRGVSGGEDPATSFAFRVLSGLPEHDRAAAWEVAKMKFKW